VRKYFIVFFVGLYLSIDLSTAAAVSLPEMIAPSIEALVLWLPQIMMSSILRKPLGSPSEREGACFWTKSALYR